MKYLRQFVIILGISCVGELLRFFLPFPIPGTVYGLVLMFLFLQFKIIKISQVKEASTFLLEIMPILFVPSTVGLMTTWEVLQPILLPVCIISVVSTFLVIAVTGKVTDFVIDRGGNDNDE